MKRIGSIVVMTLLLVAIMLGTTIMASAATVDAAYVCPGGNQLCVNNGACIGDETCVFVCPAGNQACIDNGACVGNARCAYVCPIGNQACVNNGACTIGCRSAATTTPTTPRNSGGHGCCRR